jgi:hypothetical protein
VIPATSVEDPVDYVGDVGRPILGRLADPICALGPGLVTFGGGAGKPARSRLPPLQKLPVHLDHQRHQKLDPHASNYWDGSAAGRNTFLALDADDALEEQVTSMVLDRITDA